ncbi:hypothetical protein [Allonocardiopsis opalescens]|uniref:Uncharacterized protein n=1 Tax=Allonocardiopsis opalescens TaxID=1144618 RepID=A0A2T0Q9L6_9ACTN|nr:hypothetical protein [Allonocardiopsis opalescens]PRY00554.1 hypothetical protein CLV72_102185 [Allonocardiopsis opalescens]
MSDPGRGALRLLRAAVPAAAATAIAWAGHVLGGGSAAGWPAVALTAPVVGAAFAAATRHRRSLAEIAAALGGAQLAFHLAFVALSPATHGAVPPTGPQAAGVHAGHLVTGAFGLASPGMVIGHLWATLVTAWLLAHGEDALWTLAALVRAALCPPLLRRPPLRRPWRPRAAGAGAVRAARRPVRGHPPRGPPRTAPAAARRAAGRTPSSCQPFPRARRASS